MSEKLIFEQSKHGRIGCSLPKCDVPEKSLDELIPTRHKRKSEPLLLEVGEVQIVRHFTKLSHENMAVDLNFYPLGSCTMKYNPKLNEVAASMPGFSRLHPYQPASTLQGMLALLYELEHYIMEIAGFDAASLQPGAGAHGELTSLMLIRAFHADSGEHRGKILIPDSAHGTNPASSTLCGFKSVEVKSNKEGNVDIDDFTSKVDEDVAAMMITNPNTLGLFERDIVRIAEILHDHGAFLYMDGANMNAILGIARPGDFGVDVMHFNPHKTFSTPHGGGGPGAGPIAVKKELADFLPIPIIVKKDDEYVFDCDCPKSIGKVKAFYGNIGVLVRAYSYIRSLGAEGLREAAENAVLNANYLKEKLKQYYNLPYDYTCMHELVLSAERQKQFGVTALDVAKRLIDFGFHPPTIYFPLIVHEALMIEPTETESKETLDEFVEAMAQIAKEAEESPDVVTSAPHTTAVSRLDEVTAARNPVLKYDA